MGLVVWWLLLRLEVRRGIPGLFEEVEEVLTGYGFEDQEEERRCLEGTVERDDI